MHPTLIELGPLALRSYGFMIAVGVLAAMVVLSKLARRDGVDPERVLDMAFWGVLTGLVTSRIGYVLVEWPRFARDPLEIVRIWHGGLVFYWGLIGGVAAALVCIRKYRLPFWETVDAGAVAVPLAHGFGRLGCFFAGCCFGRDCPLPWAVTFTNPESLAPLGVPLHPTQLYSAAGNFTIFVILLLTHGRRRFTGQILGMYLVLYAAARFTVEFFRGDYRGQFFLGVLSPAQAIGVVLALMGITLLVVRARRAGRDGS